LGSLRFRRRDGWRRGLQRGAQRRFRRRTAGYTYVNGYLPRTVIFVTQEVDCDGPFKARPACS